MLPIFLVEETTVRESGESAAFEVSGLSSQGLLLTFGITHAIEHESIGVEIYGSLDKQFWTPRPLVSFAPKSYCGTYQVVLPHCEARYLKAKWKLLRWSSRGGQPFFRFYIFAQPAEMEMMVTAGAA
ncbi:MAG TPA: hypothetical protein VHC72_03865 [Bryobacteraceae bacterium]|nr:hypothetical protein [Bryobacteraceae bacterium]